MFYFFIFIKMLEENEKTNKHYVTGDVEKTFKIIQLKIY